MTGSSPTFENCIFAGNLGTMAGGVMIQDSAPIFIGCRFSGNAAGAGGGAVCVTSDGTPTFIDCEFRDNEGIAAGVAKLEGASALFDGCVLAGNYSSTRGGAIHADDGSVLTVSACTITNNASGAGGGMIAVDNSHVDISNTIIAFAAFGGSVTCIDNGTAALQCTDVHGNMGGNWYGCLMELEGVDGNFDADPLFCGEGPLLGPYTLDSNSPCAAANQGDCGRVGALPVRCGAAGVGHPAADRPAARLTSVANNPFRESTRLSYRLAAANPAAPLRIAVHGSDGRCVRVLLEGSVGAGVGQVAWDGRDAGGRLCAAGVYYVYLRSAQERAARAIVLTR